MTHKELNGFIGLGGLLAILLAVILAKQCTDSRTETRLQEAIGIAQEADSIADISKARADSTSVEEVFAPITEVDSAATGAARKKQNTMGKKKPAGRNALPADMSSPHDRPVENGR